MFRNIITTLFIASFALGINAQKTLTHKTPVKLEKIKFNYKKSGLKLNDQVYAKFNQIVNECNLEISKLGKQLTSEEKDKFNTIIKKYDLKIYEILSKEEWNQYIKSRKLVEPYKNYKL